MLAFFPTSFLLFTWCGLVFAQNLSVPTSWRKPNTSLPLSDRVSISQNAIDKIIAKLDTNTAGFNGIGYWQAGNVWSAMANNDYIAGSAMNKEAVLTNIATAFSLYPNFDQYGYNDDAMWWAQAALYAYRAYITTAQNLPSVEQATATWTHVTQYVITPEDVAAGTHPKKGFSIEGQCEGQSMIGGVFWRPTSDDTALNSITAGLYVTLSASLAEITGNRTYLDAAIATAEWIQRINLQSDNIVLDTISAKDCTRSPANWIFTYNSGKYIEGLSVLADVSGDAKWNSLMVGIIASSVNETHWQGSDGIITEGADISQNNDGVGFKAVFIRSLFEAYMRNAENTNLRTLIQSYIDVQYNALLDLAVQDNAYSANWHGPAKPFTTWGQLAALDVLASAIGAQT